jgi:adenylylsulfate kinase-like enzyme
MEENNQPTVYFITGPNGAGKTTFAENFYLTLSTAANSLMPT